MKMTTDEIDQNSTSEFGDSEATVQPPPSEGDLMDVSTTDEEAQNGNVIAGNAVDNPQDGDDPVHDQLPSVEQYKAEMSFNNKDGASNSKSRAGLYTFLGLFLVTIVVTVIAVPVAMKGKGGGKSSSAAAKGNSGSYSSYSNDKTNYIMTAYPHIRPTQAPVVPPVAPELSRLEKTFQYLRVFGIVDWEILEDELSPQFLAAKWIAEDDGYAMEIPTGGSPGSSSYADTRFTERWALAVFFFATGGERWGYQTNFMAPIDHCLWSQLYSNGYQSVVHLGVTKCVQTADGERVQRVELSGNNLVGVIPMEVQYLPYLEAWISPLNPELVESDSLKPFLTMAENLSHLELQYCSVKGTIPDELSNLEKLQFLGLGNTGLTGEIPESFFSLTNLVVLGLDDNMLQAPIASFAKFTKIEKLYLEDNLFTGEITQEMVSSGWQNVLDLDLSGNRLDGPLPRNIWSMKNLEVIDFHGNDFIGQIPEIEAVHDKMTFLALQDNSLEWRIPESISNLVNLKHLDISANKMTIPFPSTMSQMTNLVALYTGINGFDAHPIPSFLWDLTNLREISMKQNKLTGEIPTYFGMLTKLKVLDLDFNHLEGTIPMEIGILTNLDTLLLNRNYLNGTIPETFSYLTDMDVLVLDGNSITGSADPFCNANINTTFFSADCDTSDPEVTCSCCSLCCNDNNSTCNNLDWRINLDGIWEYDFQRFVYTFTQELMPPDAKANYTTDKPDSFSAQSNPDSFSFVEVESETEKSDEVVNSEVAKPVESETENVSDSEPLTETNGTDVEPTDDSQRR
eukprot:CAMPEP_0172412928 /NCGR_PEP_ID=MMETSP1061-20121228/78158_1 /TAXON_ID=37318 /ORGANISM="Pseudo-nitzschia pungens, Strain cf. pungens" /LENGTH=794 /DNA_ID=CAMNT_0013149179 /DNA_START=188 /DNA_END=2572 /DNA_ORIENTATION=-